MAPLAQAEPSMMATHPAQESSLHCWPLCDPEKVPPLSGLCFDLPSEWFSRQQRVLLHSDVCCSNQLLLHDKLSPNLVVDNLSHLAAYSPAIWAGLSWAVFLDLTTIWHTSEFKGAHSQRWPRSHIWIWTRAVSSRGSVPLRVASPAGRPRLLLVTGCPEGSPRVPVPIRPLLASHCGCSIGRGQPRGQAKNLMGEDCRKASIPGGVIDCVRRAWYQERPGTLLLGAHVGPTPADRRHLRDLLSSGCCSSQSPAHLPGTAMALCATEALSEGLGGMSGMGPPQPPSHSLQRQEAAEFMCMQLKYFLSTCCVPGLALRLGVVRNPAGCGIA